MKAQNWTAIAIDFVLLVLGFLGVLAANWNQQRLEDRQTKELLSQVGEELKRYEGNLGQVPRYYDIPARYADVAFRGWSGDPSLSDRDFVIAAYQASQVTGAASDGMVIAQMFGADRLRTIKDPGVRRALGEVIGFDKTPMQLSAVLTPYRQNVRKLIPDSVQNSIRGSCGDRPQPGTNRPELPAKCNIVIPADVAAQGSATLRAHPELMQELQWHRAAVANQIYNVRDFQVRLRRFLSALPAS
ncbi:hypothetical protein OMW55_03085 [Sphingomonas sp. BN140010]|uniref:Uncharacterized protein n=1 Tax=Sphingomonas arvum TaxID=2992113 RepID=A0ABT3JCZ6_9SPHN|nr:hypothetical protein [Sphingomonas sp. BN140010]MCW3796789.1 hypothetical protein [Sphingomonas sp. BN140010]